MSSHAFTATYNPWLVALSIVIALCASYAALDMAARTAATQRAWRRLRLRGGAFAMGASTRSMRYVDIPEF